MGFTGSYQFYDLILVQDHWRVRSYNGKLYFSVLNVSHQQLHFMFFVALGLCSFCVMTYLCQHLYKFVMYLCILCVLKYLYRVAVIFPVACCCVCIAAVAEHELLQSYYLTGCTAQLGGQCGEAHQGHIWAATWQATHHLRGWHEHATGKK